MEILEPFSVPFVDVRGKVRRIRALSLRDRRWFVQLHEAAQELVLEHDFRSLYDDRRGSHFAALVDECLLLHRISPAWVDAYMTTRLLFGMGEEPAILMSLNFPPDPQPAGKEGFTIPEDLDPDAYQVASLWGATENLEHALRVATSYPWNEVQATLRARNYQIQRASGSDDDERRLQESREGMDRLIQSGKLQEFLDARRSEAFDLEELPDDYF